MPDTGVDYVHADVPTPEQILGHRVGGRHTEPHQIVAYFEAVAAASDRVTVAEHGRSYQNRPMIYAVVTSPANHARIADIQEENRRLSDEPGSVDAAKRAEQPAIVYMGYGVHGDEASGSEAALLMLYHLAAGEGGNIEQALDELVILIEPAMNPDGRHRFTSWVNGNRGHTPVTDPNNREHNQPWPGGRRNHYWFDANRDYLALQHPEGQARQELFNIWRPQIVNDVHEMGSESTYFFQPGVEERVNPLTPPLNQELTARIAEYHADVFGELGQLFFTRETFDDFFVGKGSTYPDVTGAIGILYEQGSSRGLKRETDHHGVLTYAVTVRNQFATSLSTLDAALAMREELLEYQQNFFTQAREIAREFPEKAYIVPLTEHRNRAQALLQMMARHRIEMYALAESVEVNGRAFAPGEAVIVPSDQPQFRLLQSIMETRTEFDDNRFYDVSTWTKPLAFGVDVRPLLEDPEPYLGAPAENLDFDGGALVGGRSDYAYLMRWDSYFAPRALYRLQDAGVHTRVIQRPFTTLIDGERTRFERGTVLIPVKHTAHDLDADGDVHVLIEQAVANDHVRVYAAASMMTIDGPDFGTRRFGSLLNKPEVAIITGSGSASSAVAGEVWHLLDHRFEMPVTLLDADRASASRLRRYNRLVLSSRPRDVSTDDIEQWVREGGVLIAIGAGARWVAGRDWAELEEKEFDVDELLKDTPWEDLADVRGAQRIGGSIFEAALDVTHPVAYGYGERVALFRTDNTFYEPAEAPGVTVATYTDNPLLSGYLSKELAEIVPGSAAIAAKRLGSGRIVLFMDNPNFRNFWYGTNGLFLNAVFFGDTF